MESRGFAKLSTVINIALGVGFAASVFLNFAQNQRSQQDRKLLQGEITDLRYQVNQDKLALEGGASPSPSVSPVATPESGASPSSSPDASPSPPAVLDAGTGTAKLSCAANLRSDATQNSTLIIRLVPKGTNVTLGADLRNGYQQVTVNGKTGYILDSCL